ncbi:MAG TPA: hypothetical protein VFL83_12300 [Anaeromyxobacter sp.]|nr:hypothetical protein [Anaeromyxobacter sp.]
MTPALHALPPPAPRAPPLPALPALTHLGGPSLASGTILAFILLALLLQASFFAGLASGRLGGPEPVAPRAALAR